MNVAPRYRIPIALVGVMILVAAVTLSTRDVRAASATVTRVAAIEMAQRVEVSLVASAPIRYDLRQVQSNWIVVDVSPAELGIPAGVVPFTGHMVTKVRVGQFQSDVVRVVVELARPTPFQVTATTGRTGVVVEIGSPTTAFASGGVGPMTQAPPQTPVQAQAPQETTISFKSTAVLPQPVRPQTSPAQPSPAAPSPPPAQRFQSVVPGKGIGPVQLGMRVQDVVATLGQPRRSQGFSDGTTVYEWFGPPANSGLGVRATHEGVVYRAWVINDTQYAVRDRIHVGSTETEVRAAFGDPAQVVADASHGFKTLTYPALGLWVVIQTDKQYEFYNQVFEIGVTPTTEVAAGR
jgi:hypothetical protein